MMLSKDAMSEYYKEVKDIITEEQKSRGLLIHMLQNIQKEYNYLPEEKLREISADLKIPLSDIYSTASFYKHFYFKPRGKNVVCVCTGTACHVRGAGKVLEGLEGTLGIRTGETTPDLSVTLETVGCVGCCGLAPVVTVNDEVIGNVDPEKIGELIDVTRSE